jgi:hypothetical protein
MAVDDLDNALGEFEQKRAQALEKERTVTSARSKFREQFMQSCHREWTRQIEETVRRLGEHGHRGKLDMTQEAHQEMLVLHVTPNLKDLPHSVANDFDFQVKIFPNEAMLRVCFVTVTPDSPEYIGHPEPYKLDDLQGENFRHVLIRHVAGILRAAMPHM